MNQRAHRADELQDSFLQATKVTKGPSLVTWGLTFSFSSSEQDGKERPILLQRK